MLLRIALLQLMPCGSIAENLKKGLDICRRAKDMGADIALFPEMWNEGYEIPQDREKLNNLSIFKDDPFIVEYGKLAAELEMAIAVTFLESTDDEPKNSVILFDRHGNRVLQYSKVHTCDFGDERMLSRGNGFPTAVLDTEKGDVTVGCMICYDREFPESARLLMLGGAELVLVPNACPMEINRLSQLRARAYENMIAVATCNYPEGKPDCNGHSTVFDGVAYYREEPFPRDMCILEADGKEGIFTADINIDELRAFRSREVHGNAYRRPEMYAELVSRQIREPFIRSDRKN